MGKSGQQSNARRYAEEDLLKAVNHPLRRQILRLLHSSSDSVSPTRLERQLALGGRTARKLSGVSYHVTVLSDYNAIECVGERQARGAMEHFYASRVEDVAWLRGVLSRTQESDERKLWPRGRPRGGRNPNGGKAE
jgi:DNA-binding transcriptional ArsR family regulator